LAHGCCKTTRYYS